MFCTYTLTIASLKMFLRNRQALFFSLFMPLIILFIFGSINFDRPTRVHIGLVTHTPSAGTAAFVAGLRSGQALITDVGTLERELEELKGGGRSAVLDIPDDLISVAAKGEPGKLKVYVNSGRPIEAEVAMSIVHQIADRASLAAAQVPMLFTVSQETVNAHNSRYIEFLLPGVMSMAIMQMSVFSVAFVFTRYKEQGILKRLMATPMRAHQFVTANIITRLLMALAQAGIFVGLAIANFHVHIAGTYWLLAGCVLLGALMFLGLGFTISGLSKSVETVPLLSNIVVFPMLFVGNVFFPSSGMPPWLQTAAGYLPLTYFSNAMRGVMLEGSGPGGISHELLGMAVWAVILIGLAIGTFRIQEREGE